MGLLIRGLMLRSRSVARVVVGMAGPALVIRVVTRLFVRIKVFG